MAHGKARGEDYKIRWEVKATPSAELATKGEPFSMPLLSGESYDFGTVLGRRPVVLVFWASWCAPCIEEAPHLVQLHKTYGAKGVEFISVSIDTKDDRSSLEAAVDKLRLSYPVGLDPDGQILAKYAKGASIPLTFVLDRSGIVTFSHRNYQQGDEAKLEAAIIDAVSP